MGKETQNSGIEWKDGKAYYDGRVATWAPQPGSQVAFLECPVFEVLYEGSRGPGKTDALLMDFAQHIGQGWGSDWKGIIFRRSYKELEDVIGKSLKWFNAIWPDAMYNRAKSFWEWPTGETLSFRHMADVQDYYRYHGHAYPFIGWEELTNWATDECYKMMISCIRSTCKGIPLKLRATTNPYGIGHNWVKARFHLPTSGMVGKLVRAEDGDRIAIHGKLSENKLLLGANPDYPQKLRASARNKSQLAAWIDGSWDITSGGMFDDIWNRSVHVLPDIPLNKIPKGWRIDRSYDHGSSKPFSVGWWAESNGEPMSVAGRKIGSVPGDLIRVAEWYGSTSTPNEGSRMLAINIAEGILDRETEWGIHKRVQPGPADTSIFDDENGNCVATDMALKGIHWLRADKTAGSRKQGWEQIRKRLKAATASPREEKGLFICERCTQFSRTVPVLPRSDSDPDDVDTDAEDHIGDETRYRVRKVERKVTQTDI